MLFDSSKKHDFYFEMLSQVYSGNDLRVKSFKCKQRFSDVYSVEINFVTRGDRIEIDKLIDTAVSLSIQHRHDGERFFHGYVESVRQYDQSDAYQEYAVILRPSLYRLKYRSNCRIFQFKTVEEIVNEIFKEHNISLVHWSLYEKHQKREYCVQYRETDLEFIQRILAEEGISYYFEQQKDKHELYLTDATITNKNQNERDELLYNSLAGTTTKATFASEFRVKKELQSDRFVMNDRWFKSPDYKFIHQKSDPQSNSGYLYEAFDQPGRFKDDTSGKLFTKYWMESKLWKKSIAKGATNCIHLVPGYRFTLQEHEDEKLNQTYLNVKVVHSGVQPQALEEQSDEAPTTYDCKFQCIPAKTPFRPAQRKQRPIVDGPQIATVVGPKDEEIFCDEFGRVKVQFQWDRYGRSDEHSSCWVRIANNWAGTGWGHISLPRIGQEVIVDFVEGDPDQPIITGRTYHARNMPPYALPANKTKSGIKSKTHKGSGFNEFSFEDDADRELVYMHAQKDNQTVIENDENHSIGHDRAKMVKNDQSENIGHDKSISVGNDHTETIGHDARYNVNNDVTYKVERNQEEKYGKDHIHYVGNIHKQNVYADHLEVIGRDYEGEIAGKMKLDVGASITTNTGQVHNLMAGQRFEITGPGGKITIDSSGIKLEAPKIDLIGAVNMGGSGSAQVPALDLAANDIQPICEECLKQKGAANK